MVLRVRSNIKEVSKSLTRLQREQIPYAASTALNTVAFDTRKFIVSRLWPNSFPQAHNKRFPSVLYRVLKARKTRLTADVHEQLDRSYVGLHIRGGTKTPHRSSNVAVPVQARRTASGRTRKSDTPRALKDAFVANFKGQGPAIFQRRGKQLLLMYVLKRSTHINAAYPFFTAGYGYAESRWSRAFDDAMRRALATA